MPPSSGGIAGSNKGYTRNATIRTIALDSLSGNDFIARRNRLKRP